MLINASICYNVRAMPVICLPMPPYETLDQAAAAAGISRRLLTKWISEGKLKGFKVEGDRRRYVDMAELERIRAPKPLESSAEREETQR